MLTVSGRYNVGPPSPAPMLQLVFPVLHWLGTGQRVTRTVVEDVCMGSGYISHSELSARLLIPALPQVCAKRPLKPVFLYTCLELKVSGGYLAFQVNH